MSFAALLDTLLIGPLETMFASIYLISYNISENPGVAIIGLSLAMNLLLMPLYRRTDAIQLEAIETEKRLKPFVSHIKKAFRGNEQFLMLQTCYRQNGYRPTDALKGISPLVLEIPFFMAAYQFLSGLHLLQGAGFGPIRDLGVPDGLLVLGGFSINVLPIVMTVINFLSSRVYTRDAPLKTKLQLYGMAVLFLVLLYDSPAGLAFYWTLNNLFSLVKNLLMKTRNPGRTAAVSASVFSLGLCAYAGIRCLQITPVQIAETLTVAALLQLPLLGRILRRRFPGRPVPPDRNRPFSFFCACAVLALLLGLLIPSTLIRTSPEEFIVAGSDRDPLGYVAYTALICGGFFLLWMNLFYALSSPRGRRNLEWCLWALCAVSLVDYLGFGRHYGILSSQLTFEEGVHPAIPEIWLNLAVLAAAVGAVWQLLRKKPELLRIASCAAALAMVAMSAVNLVQSREIIHRKTSQMQPPAAQTEPLLQLSRTGKNVVIVMMDRSASGLVPYLFHEMPQLQQQFAGFTYYPNTLSFGSHTNVGLPGVFGGYEYTPLEMNRRDQQTLEQKHNEALKMLPVLFREQGFRATVCDPTYAGYDWIPDLSIYDDCPGVDAHITMGRYNRPEELASESTEEAMQHKFLHYSLFKAAPVMLHGYLYDSGSYQNVRLPAKQYSESTVKAYGISDVFRDSYNVLRSLPDMTAYTDGEPGSFIMMCNDTTHSPQLLQLPGYEMQLSVDNTAFDEPCPSRTDGQGHTITMTTPMQVKHYHCNMASYLQLGRWLDELRENGVYDNTRIILVGDHGYYLHLQEAWEFGTGWDEDIMYFNPTLMVKDFGSTGAFRTDERFMTNADVPSLALAGLVQHPLNPFTGREINMLPKQAGTLYLLASHQWDVSKNNGTAFLPDNWLAVSGDMKDPSCWKYVDPGELP